jgi:membrane protease YdiL (CAAX protease family)
LPAAVACGLSGFIPVPGKALFAADPAAAWAFALVLIPLALELLFRGLAHGMMAQLATIQDSESRWFFSGPTIGSSLLYTAAVSVQMAMMPADPASPQTLVFMIQIAAVAAIFGLFAGMVRERSHSILAAWIFHAAAAATLLLTYGPP